jgi:hypothetical protein
VNSILNGIAVDMKKETETSSKGESGPEKYWENMRRWGREAALSKINAEKIADYKERLRDQALNTTVLLYTSFLLICSFRILGDTWYSSKSQFEPY